MPLAKDEVWGLAIACAIGASALGLFTYRQLKGPPPTAAEQAAEEAAEEIEAVEEASQASRDAFAESLEIAFVDDGADASVNANDTTLAIVWFPCSKPMLDRLLRRKHDALTRKVRQASGLSIEHLRALGFTRVVCDNTRGTKSVDDLAPRTKRR